MRYITLTFCFFILINTAAYAQTETVDAKLTTMSPDAFKALSDHDKSWLCRFFSYEELPPCEEYERQIREDAEKLQETAVPTEIDGVMVY